jgi:hypothetical protein
MERAHDPDQKLAERYFLGELTDAEAEAFEAHYFDCQACGEYVAEEQLLIDGIRRVPREDRVSPPLPEPGRVLPFVRRFQKWIPAAAAAALLLAIRIPPQPVPAMPVMQIVEPVTVVMSADRATTKPLVFAAGKPVALDLQVPPAEVNYPRYELVVRNTSTEVTVGREQLAPVEVNKPIPLLLRDLPAGSYEVAVEGVREDGKRSPIAAQTFEVRVN